MWSVNFIGRPAYFFACGKIHLFQFCCYCHAATKKNGMGGQTSCTEIYPGWWIMFPLILVLKQFFSEKKCYYFSLITCQLIYLPESQAWHKLLMHWICHWQLPEYSVQFLSIMYTMLRYKSTENMYNKRPFAWIWQWYDNSSFINFISKSYSSVQRTSSFDKTLWPSQHQSTQSKSKGPKEVSKNTKAMHQNPSNPLEKWPAKWLRGITIQWLSLTGFVIIDWFTITLHDQCVWWMKLVHHLYSSNTATNARFTINDKADLRLTKHVKNVILPAWYLRRQMTIGRANDTACTCQNLQRGQFHNYMFYIA